MIFEQYVQSEKTREQYLYHLSKFAEHHKLKSIDGVLSLRDLKEKIEDYVILFKNNGKSVSYIRLTLFVFQSFCKANELDHINFKRIRKMLCKKQNLKTRSFSTEEIKLMLGVTKELRNKAIILFLSASGVGRGALPVLKIKDLKEMPNDCLSVAVYEGTDEEYATFINKESKEALVRYFDKRKSDGETLEPNHPVFRTKYQLGVAKPKPISEKVVSNFVLRAKVNAGIDLNDVPTNFAMHSDVDLTQFSNQKTGKPKHNRETMGHSASIPLDNSYDQVCSVIISFIFSVSPPILSEQQNDFF